MSKKPTFHSMQFGKPDPACDSAMQAINQNPKFARLLVFSVNTLTALVHPPNTKHRDNAHYVFTEKGHIPLIAALKNHIGSDTVLNAATKCLLGIVGEGKFTDEDKAKKFVEDGVVEALVNAFNHKAEKSSSTQKLMITLLGILGVNPSNCAAIAEQGGIDLCLNVAGQEKAKPSVVKQAIQTLERISSNPTGRAVMVKTGGIQHLIAMFNKKPDDPIVIQGGLRTLGNLTKTKEAVAVMKESGETMNAVVKVLEKHPGEKQIVNLASGMLSKISTKNDLDKAIAAVRSGNTAQMSVLASLVLVDDMMEEAVKKGIVTDLIAILEKNAKSGGAENYELIRNCTTALGRIAEMDYKQAQDIISQGGIDAIAKACDIPDAEVLRSCSDTLQKLCINEANIKIAVNKGCLAKLCKACEMFPKDEKLAESVCAFVGQAAAESSARDELINTGAAKGLVSQMRAFFENRKIQEQGFRALDHISTHKSGPQHIVDAGAVDHMKELTKKHPEWKKAGVNAVGMVQNLAKNEAALPVLKKANAMEAVVEILSGKSVEKGKVAVTTEVEGGDDIKDVDLAEDEKAATEQILTSKQEQDLKDASVEILSKIADPAEINKVKATMSEIGKGLSKKTDAGQIATLESKLNTAACLSLIPGLGESILKEDVHNQAAELAKKVQTLPDCEAKTPVLSSLIKFYDNLSDLNNKENSKGLYTHKGIGKDTVEFFVSVLEQNDEPIPVILALRSLGKNLSIKGNVVELEKNGTFLGVEKIGNKPVMEKILEATIKNMTKYADNEEIQIRCLELLDKASQISPEFANMILKLGGSRQILSRLETGNLPSKKTAVQSLQILNKLATNKEALTLLANQKGQQAVMSYVARNRNEKEIQEAAAPLLEKLSKIQTEDAAQSIQKDIKGLLEEVKKSSAISMDKDQDALAGTVEVLADLAIVDRNITPITQEGAQALLLNVIVQESKFSEEELADKGVLVTHDRLMNSSLGVLKKVLANPAVRKSEIPKTLVAEGLVEAIVDTLKNRSSSEEIAVAALSTLNELLSNPVVRDAAVQKAIKKDVAPALTALIEHYKDQAEISGNANRCLMTLSQASPDIAAKVGQKAFIKTLVKDTRTMLKDNENEEESNNIAHQNLQTLSTLSKMPQNSVKLIDEGAVDIAVGVLKKHNAAFKSNLNQASSDYVPTYEINLKHLPKKQISQDAPITTEDLASSSVAILNSLLIDPAKFEAILNKDNLLEIMNAVETTNDSDVVQGILSCIAKASKNAALAEILSENEAVDKVMGAINRFPTNVAIKREAGIILENLGASQLIDQVAEQVNEIADALDTDNQESVEAFQSANLYLSNLMATKPSEDGTENYTTLVQAMEKSMAKTVAAPQLMASQLLLVSRLAQRSEEDTRDDLRNSDIPQVLVQELLVENPNYTSVESGQLADIVLETVKNIASIKVATKKSLDPQTGVEMPAEKKEADKLSKALLKNNAQALDKIVKIVDPTTLENNHAYDPETVDKAMEALTEVAQTYDGVGKALVEKGAVEIAAEYLQANQPKNAELSDILNDPKALHALASSARFFSAVIKHPDGFEKIKKKNILPQFYAVLKKIELNEDWGKKPNDPKAVAQKDAIEAILEFTQALSDTPHDKSPMLDAEAPAALLNIVKSVNSIAPEKVAASEDLTNVLDLSMKSLKNFSKDPGLARMLIRAKGHEDISNTLHQLSVAYGEQEAQVDPDELAKLKKIKGSSNPLDQATESALLALDELSKQPKYAKEMDLLNEESASYQDLLNLVSTKIDNPLICVEILKIAQNSLKATPKEKILENTESLESIKAASEAIADLYPKIDIIQNLAKSVQHLVDHGEMPDTGAEKGQNIQKALAGLAVAQHSLSTGEQSKATESAAEKSVKKVEASEASLKDLQKDFQEQPKVILAAAVLTKEKKAEVPKEEQQNTVPIARVDPKMDALAGARPYDVEDVLVMAGTVKAIEFAKGSKVVQDPKGGNSIVVNWNGNPLVDSDGKPIEIPAGYKLADSVGGKVIVVSGNSEVLYAPGGKPITVPQNARIVTDDQGRNVVVGPDGNPIVGPTGHPLVVSTGAKILATSDPNQAIIVNCPGGVVSSANGKSVGVPKNAKLVAFGAAGAKKVVDEAGKDVLGPDGKPIIVPVGGKLLETPGESAVVVTADANFLRTPQGKLVVVPQGSRIIANYKGENMIITPEKRIVTDGLNNPIIVPPGSKIIKDPEGRYLVLTAAPGLLTDAAGKGIQLPKGSKLVAHPSGNKAVVGPDGQPINDSTGSALIVSPQAKIIEGPGSFDYLSTQGYDTLKDAAGKVVVVPQNSKIIKDSKGDNIVVDGDGKPVKDSTGKPVVAPLNSRIDITPDGVSVIISEVAEALSDATGKVAILPKGTTVVIGENGEKKLMGEDGKEIKNENGEPVILPTNSRLENLPDSSNIVLAGATELLTGEKAGVAKVGTVVLAKGAKIHRDADGSLVIINPPDTNPMTDASGEKICLPEGSKLVEFGKDGSCVVIVPSTHKIESGSSAEVSSLKPEDLLQASQGRPIDIKKGAKLAVIGRAGASHIIDASGQPVKDENGNTIIVPAGTKLTEGPDEGLIVVPQNCEAIFEPDGTILQVVDGAEIFTDNEGHNLIVNPDGTIAVGVDGLPVILPQGARIIPGSKGKPGYVIALCPEPVTNKDSEVIAIPRKQKLAKQADGTLRVVDSNGNPTLDKDGKEIIVPCGSKIIEGAESKDIIVNQGTDVILGDDNRALVVEDGTQILRDAEGNYVLVDKNESVVTHSDGETPFILPPGSKIFTTTDGKQIVLSVGADALLTGKNVAITVPLNAKVIKGPEGTQKIVNAQNQPIIDEDGNQILMPANSKLLQVPNSQYVIASHGSDILTGVNKKPVILQKGAEISVHPMTGQPMIADSKGEPILNEDGQPIIVPHGSKILLLPEDIAVVLTPGHSHPINPKKVGVVTKQGGEPLTVPLHSKITTGQAGEQKVVNEHEEDIIIDDKPLLVCPGSKIVEVGQESIILNEGTNVYKVNDKPLILSKTANLVQIPSGQNMVVEGDGKPLLDENGNSLIVAPESKLIALSNGEQVLLVPGVDVLCGANKVAVVVPKGSTIVKAEGGERLIVNDSGEPCTNAEGEPILVHPASKLIAVGDQNIVVSHNAELLRGSDGKIIPLAKGSKLMPLPNGLRVIVNPEGKPIAYGGDPIVVPPESEIIELPDGQSYCIVPEEFGLTPHTGEQDFIEVKVGGQDESPFVTNPELLTQLDMLADTLEELKDKIVKGEAKPGEIVVCTQIVDAIDGLASKEDGANKVVQYGMLDSCVELLDAKASTPALKKSCVSIIKKLSEQPKTQEKIIENPLVLGVVLANLVETEQAHKKKVAELKAQGKTAELSSIEKHTQAAVLDSLDMMEKLSSTDKGREKIIEKNSIAKCIGVLKDFGEDKDIVEKANKTLSGLIATDRDIDDFEKNNGAQAVLDNLERYLDDLPMLIALTDLVGRTATSERMQTEYGTKGVVGTITKGNKKYPTSLELNTNTCFAFSSLVLNHPENSKRVLQSESLDHIKNLIHSELDQAKLMGNAATLFNNLAFKSMENKQALAKIGIVELLVLIFSHYSKVNNRSVLKQVLKAIGNLALFTDNAITIVKYGFIPPAATYLQTFTQEADLVKLCLAVVGNLAIEDIADQVDKMIEQNVIEAIVTCVKAHELNTDLLITAIESLGNLIKTKEHAQKVAQKDGLEAVLRILKSQDFSTELMEKCVKILSDLVAVQENHQQFIDLGGHQSVIQLISSQSDVEEILLPCFKILARIASDKPKCKIVYMSGFIDVAYTAFADSTFSPESITELLNVTAKLSNVEEATVSICEKAFQVIRSINDNIFTEKLVQYGTLVIANLLGFQSNIDAVIRDKGIECLNEVIINHTSEHKIVGNAFRGLSSIALHSEELRQLCLKNKSEKVVKDCYEDPKNTDNQQIVSEGKLTYQHLTTPHKSEIPQEVDFNISKKADGPLVTKEIKNFLIAGKIIKLYKKDGHCKEMHMFMSNDLKEILAKRPHKPEIKQQWRLTVHQIKSLQMGYDAKSAFDKHGGLFRKKPDPKTCFSIYGPMEADGQRVLHVQAGNELECKKWYDALTKVLQDFKREFGKNKT